MIHIDIDPSNESIKIFVDTPKDLGSLLKIVRAGIAFTDEKDAIPLGIKLAGQLDILFDKMNGG